MNLWIWFAALAGVVLVVLICPVLTFLIYKYFRKRELEKQPYSTLLGLQKQQSFRVVDLIQKEDIPLINFNDITLLKCIGKGAYGVVWKASVNGEIVALKKLLLSQISESHSGFQDFIREIHFVSLLKHKNIVKFVGLAYDTRTEELGLVLEFMRYGTIDHVVNHLQMEDRTETVTVILHLLIGAARGMRYLHSRKPPVLHRDVKASNFLVSEDWTCKVADFGVSKVKRMTEDGTMVGTPQYMAPEILRRQPYNELADIYSFGMMMIELFGGQKPFYEHRHKGQAWMIDALQKGIVSPTVPDNIPNELQKLIGSCLQNDAKIRPSFKRIVKELKSIRRSLKKGVHDSDGESSPDDTSSETSSIV